MGLSSRGARDGEEPPLFPAGARRKAARRCSRVAAAGLFGRRACGPQLSVWGEVRHSSLASARRKAARRCRWVAAAGLFGRRACMSSRRLSQVVAGYSCHNVHVTCVVVSLSYRFSCTAPVGERPRVVRGPPQPNEQTLAATNRPHSLIPTLVPKRPRGKTRSHARAKLCIDERGPSPRAHEKQPAFACKLCMCKLCTCKLCMCASHACERGRRFAAAFSALTSTRSNNYKTSGTLSPPTDRHRDALCSTRGYAAMLREEELCAAALTVNRGMWEMITKGQHAIGLPFARYLVIWPKHVCPDLFRT